MYSGYNESLLILNNITDDPACKGTVDASVTPSVLRFEFPLNSTNSCGSIFRTYSAAGTGEFSDFSNIQTVNISGMIRSSDPTIGTVTYNTDLKYFYSCAYPLEYLVNNTQISVSASTIAVKDSNGSFISTLSIGLYNDLNHTAQLVIPVDGLELKTEICTSIKATNLTTEYYVLLDRCYASVSPQANENNVTIFDLFYPCYQDKYTVINENGVSHRACFSFPVFRFTGQNNEVLSTYYLHCITRLCERSTCMSFMQCPNPARRRRNAVSEAVDGVTEHTTLSSPPITIRGDRPVSIKEPRPARESSDNGSRRLGVAVGVLSSTCVVVIAIAAVIHRRLKTKG
ncbi:hypothetical protein DPEC_G00049700 [Dallia pectoralis]|uniref:Uncharacterized protein n=1 Tax=Dallia pectoralis TaxID=75939 RepID=A0ACC2HBG1_DALPE|nr:hypothetical protein DPEC_G00049700 [Dallia pectoralis]